MTQALPISMKNFQRLLSSLSPDIAICVRGRHAVGKSEGVYQGAALRRSDFYKSPENCKAMVDLLGGKVSYLKADNYVTEWKYDMGLPVIERRLSQMTEGDVVGLPNVSGRWTMFKPCDWLVQACEVPVVLFLDERNRAIEQVKQSVFQLMDSKIFYGNRLHDETFIAIAENIGDSYTVNQSDPAEISRAATVHLEPTKEEWLNFAKNHVDFAMYEFLKEHPKAIEHDGVFEPNHKYPDRRSWFKLDKELARMDLYRNVNDDMFYCLVGSFVGPEIASAFKRYVAERDRNVKYTEILDNWDKAKERLGNISNEMFMELATKVTDGIERNKLKLKRYQAAEVAKFMYDCPPEIQMKFWSKLSAQQNVAVLQPFVRDIVLANTVGNKHKSARPVSLSKEEREKEMANDNSTKASKAVARRGAR